MSDAHVIVSALYIVLEPEESVYIGSYEMELCNMGTPEASCEDSIMDDIEGHHVT